MAAPQDYASAGAERLVEFLDGLQVDRYWLKGHHIVWETGQQNAPPDVGRAHYTHCSTFVAAACLRLGIYVLRPPFHDELLLASAQDHWLRGYQRYQGEAASAAGWLRIGRSGDVGVIKLAQEATNKGKLVLASYAQRPAIDDKTGQPIALPGHIAILRPLVQRDSPPNRHDPLTSAAKREPHVCAAGHVNSPDLLISQSFQDHTDAWPNNIDFYAHSTPLEHDLK
ncbi:hypothetical protein [Dyella acidisoli]|uniref:hypothetical protein n=1 Tax=Dyella acidisoli TaxID=1867834 RepID=UPI0024E126E3|nr:hypothetical protein [Dyella acidisoli]